ncbi:polyprenyl synthetase family protein [Thermodesulfobacteriota bacterium]
MNKKDFDLNSYLVSKRNQVNNALQACFQDSTAPSRIKDAMTYSLMAGGKRLRPILCIAAAEAVGGMAEDALNAACAIEMIHTYSLIHDDLPAMDNDDLRRGKPTCHVAFDEATAILAGDAMLTKAFQVLSDVTPDKQDQPLLWLNVIQTIADAAGHKGMIGGQMEDIASEGAGLTLDALREMHALKTGALIDAAITTGAVLGNATLQQIDRLARYSNNIGLAFQVADDILNVEGDPLLMGKAVGTDKARNKSTYPSLMGIEESREFAKELINSALQALDIFDNRSDPLRAIACYIIERNQ